MSLDKLDNENATVDPLAGITRRPFPKSQKVYLEGSIPSLRVAMREVRQCPTRSTDDALLEDNPPILL